MATLTKQQQQTAAATRARQEKERAAPTANRLRKLRLELGLTQSALARRTAGKVSVPAIRKIEGREKLSATTETIEALAEAMGIRPAVLMGWNE